MRLAAQRPKISIWVSSVEIQYVLRIAGARKANTTRTTARPGSMPSHPRDARFHAGLPNSPSGRTDSTTASRTKVKMIE